jgi:DNA invertase Pin-like site-specific DNA recombinase
MTEPTTPRVFGYARASTDKQVASPETQKQIISEYAGRLGKTVDDFYVDPASSGKKRLCAREAGFRLMIDLRPGDTVIVARLDRLSRSLIDFAEILDAWTKKKVCLHLCDFPGGGFDPDNPMSEMMIGILIVFANYERRLISQRTREGLQARKQRGEKYTRWPPYGWKWVTRKDSQRECYQTFKVADEYEVAIMKKAVEMEAAGYSIDQIRQYLNYEWKVRTRTGGHWTLSGVQSLIQKGLRLMLGEARADDQPSAEDAVLTELEPVEDIDD